MSPMPLRPDNQPKSSGSRTSSIEVPTWLRTRRTETEHLPTHSANPEGIVPCGEVGSCAQDQRKPMVLQGESPIKRTPGVRCTNCHLIVHRKQTAVL